MKSRGADDSDTDDANDAYSDKEPNEADDSDGYEERLDKSKSKGTKRTAARQKQAVTRPQTAVINKTPVKNRNKPRGGETGPRVSQPRTPRAGTKQTGTKQKPQAKSTTGFTSPPASDAGGSEPGSSEEDSQAIADVIADALDSADWYVHLA